MTSYPEGISPSYTLELTVMKKKRLDLLLVEEGLVESRSQAQRFIMAGQVRADGQIYYKPATLVDPDAQISLIQPSKYVSRGAEKLETALVSFNRQCLDGYICADVGASTGGFTDCLLSHGAKRVYAIDVGQNVLHWKIRNDERVIVMEKTNVRFVESLPEPVDLVVIDVSFISLNLVLPIVKDWFKGDKGEVVALIKPQFEAGRKEAARGKGVIKDTHVHYEVLKSVLEHAESEGYGVRGLIASPILGAKGNKEFLALLRFPDDGGQDIRFLIENTLDTAESSGGNQADPTD